MIKMYLSFMTAFDEHFKTRQTFLDDVTALEKKWKIKLLNNNMRKQNEITRVQSWQTEMNYGFLFHKFSDKITYDGSIDGKTPDWHITINGQNIIAEVLKLNPSNEVVKDQYEESKIGGITQYTAALEDKFLYRHQWKLEKKEMTYRNIIIDQQIPFIICLGSHISTFLFRDDIEPYFTGKKGFFPEVPDFRNNVSAVSLIDPMNCKSFFHNENCQYPLSKENIDLFYKFIQ